MRKSTFGLLVTGLLLAGVVLALYGFAFGAAWLLKGVLGPDSSFAVFLGLSIALGVAFVCSLIVYGQRTSHKSWKVNTSRYPKVKTAIDRYREKDEDVRRLLPAFLVDGRRYFLAKYVRRSEQWSDAAETGMLLLDDQGVVQTDESLFIQLYRFVRYVEDSFLYQRLRGQEDVMAAGTQTEQEIDGARSSFSGSALYKTNLELREALDAFFMALSQQMKRMASLVEGEYRWCQSHKGQVEFPFEEMTPLLREREAASAWLTENGQKIARAWARLENLKALIEKSSEISPDERTRLQRLMRGFQAAAKATSDADSFTMRLSPLRLEPYRTRTAKALRVDGQAQRSAGIL